MENDLNKFNIIKQDDDEKQYHIKKDEDDLCKYSHSSSV